MVMARKPTQRSRFEKQRMDFIVVANGEKN